MRGFREVQDHNTLHPRHVESVDASVVATRYVRVETCAADVLAHFIDHQHVDIVNGQTAHGLLRHRLQDGLSLEQVLAGDSLNQHGLVVGVFHDADAESERRLSHNEPGGFRQHDREVVHALTVKRRAAANLAHADGHHFDHTAFNVAPEAGVGLDSVDQHNAIRLGGISVSVDRHTAV